MSLAEGSRPTSPAGAGEDLLRARRLQRQLETIAQNATLALFIMDEHQQCMYMNPAAERLTGYSLSELQGKPLHDYIHHTRPDGTPYPLSECPIDQALPQNMREQGEEVFVHKNGSFYPVAFTASPIRDGDRTVGTIIEVREISEERRAEEERNRLLQELATERARLNQIFKEVPALISVTRGPEHVFELVNPAYRKMVGSREMVGKTIREALPELAGQGFFEMRDAIYATGTMHVQNEARVLADLDEDGRPEEHFLNFVTQPLRDAEGRVESILTFAVDVTEQVRARRQAEEQAVELEMQTEELQNQAALLQETQAELEATNDELLKANAQLLLRTREAAEAHAMIDAFYEAAPIPAALIGPDLRFRRINAALASIYGVPAEEVIGKTLDEVVPQYAGRVESFFRQVLGTGEPVRNIELALPSTSDPRRTAHYLNNYFPVRGRAGEVLGIGVMALDVTERYHAEAARLEQTTTIETLHRIGQSLTSELDLESIVQEVTDAATALTGAQFGAFFYNVVSEQGEGLTLYTISGVPKEMFSRFPNPRATPIFAPTFEGAGVVRSDDITQDPRYGALAPHHGMPKGHLPVTSYLAVPVISGTGEVLGGLFFGHSEPGVFRERHERLVTGIASWAAVAMDNARLYEAERRARAEAERANHAKSDFLATMSHELRTPLNAMIGYTDLLLAGIPEPIAAGPRQKVERIGLSARHLLELIEEILTFSRIEAGREQVDVETVEMGPLLGEVQALTEPLALAKGLRFAYHAPAEPRPLQSDPRKIRQILINLLGNAIKFASEGEVSLALEEIGDRAVLRVTDTGPGIAPEHLERIFDPFWQVETGKTRTQGGTGLGLTVTRRLVHMLGGEITVTSDLGRGSTFTVELPVQMPAPVTAE